MVSSSRCLILSIAYRRSPLGGAYLTPEKFSKEFVVSRCGQGYFLQGAKGSMTSSSSIHGTDKKVAVLFSDG